MYEELELYGKEKEQKTLREWEDRIDNMGVFAMNSKFSSSKETNKYVRFTEYLKEWVSDALSGSGYRIPKIQGMCNTGLLVVTFAGNKFPKDWWDIATKVGRGEEVENTLPNIDNLKENTFGEVDPKEKKDNIYATFMPAYRALKESFSKRWSIEWIFNHRQYVAERDSLAALSGLMMSLTGGTQQDIDNVLKDYNKAMPDTGRSDKERKKDASRIRKEAKEQLKKAAKKPDDDKAVETVETKETKETEKIVEVNNEKDRNSITVDIENGEKDIEIELAADKSQALNKSVNSR